MAAISPAWSLPVASWPANHALLQGMAYAVDPTTGRQWLFVGKAQSGGSGDIEDSHYHRHVLKDGRWRYVDTMIGRQFGHPQNFHVRISAAGRTWLWPSLEQYSGDRKVGVRPGRVLWRAGGVDQDAVELMRVPAGSWSVIATATRKGPARVVLRRGQTLTETYTEHDEAVLRAGRWLPLRQFTRVKLGGLYQTAAANEQSVVIFQGSTSKSHTLYRYDWSARCAAKVAMTDVMAPTGPNTSSEPEGVAFIDGAWHAAKRFNSTARRQYELFKVAF